MPGSSLIRKPHSLSDPAESQRPLTFYARIVRRHWGTIAFVSTACSLPWSCSCAPCCPPIHVGSAIIAVDRQASPETVGDDRLLTTGDDQFMATQQSLLLADTILRPVAERYDLLQREHQLRRFRVLALPTAKGACDQQCTHPTETSQDRTRSQHLSAHHHLSRSKPHR